MRKLWGILALALGACCLAPAPAPAVLLPKAGGGWLSYAPIPGAPRPNATPFGRLAAEPPAPGGHNLDYQGGPVMHTQAPYLIFWNVPTTSPGYGASITNFFTDVAADSGHPTNVFSVATQYNDNAGLIQYQTTFDKNTQVDADTNPFPASGCATQSGFSSCLTDAQLGAEIAAEVAARGWPTTLGAVYFLVLPQGVATCESGAAGAFCSPGGGSSTPRYCAYHTATGTLARPLLYAIQPYPVAPGCTETQHPNGAGSADDALSAISHESIETMTDPLVGDATAWLDGYDTNSGGEIGDKCAQSFPTGSVSYDQVINKHPYWLQPEWSNRRSPSGGNCLLSIGDAASDASPTASLGAPAGILPNTPVTLDASASADSDGSIAYYMWYFGDGTSQQTFTPQATHTWAGAASRYTVGLTVVDNSGSSTGASKTLALAQPVSAAFTAAVSGRSVTVDGGPSSSPNGAITSLSWNWGDGSPAGSGVTASHTYGADGSFLITLTVTDSLDVTGTRSASVNASAPPPPPPTPVAPPPPPTLTLAARTVAIDPRSGRGTVSATCSAPAGDTCLIAGNVFGPGRTAAAVRRRRPRTASRLGSLAATIPAGTRGKLQITLTLAARRDLSRRRSLSAQLVGSVSDRAGQRSPLRSNAVLKRDFRR